MIVHNLTNDCFSHRYNASVYRTLFYALLKKTPFLDSNSR
jgi:hypothetical protein